MSGIKQTETIDFVHEKDSHALRKNQSNTKKHANYFIYCLYLSLVTCCEDDEDSFILLVLELMTFCRD